MTADATTLVALVLLAARTASAPSESPAAIAAQALELQKQGRLAEAADAYQRFLVLAPSSWEAHSNLGVV
jgi:Flp pilus assembly protein TadD